MCVPFVLNFVSGPTFTVFPSVNDQECVKQDPKCVSK